MLLAHRARAPGFRRTVRPRGLTTHGAPAELPAELRTALPTRHTATEAELRAIGALEPAPAHDSQRHDVSSALKAQIEAIRAEIGAGDFSRAVILPELSRELEAAQRPTPSAAEPAPVHKRSIEDELASNSSDSNSDDEPPRARTCHRRYARLPDSGPARLAGC